MTVFVCLALSFLALLSVRMAVKMHICSECKSALWMSLSQPRQSKRKPHLLHNLLPICSYAALEGPLSKCQSQSSEQSMYSNAQFVLSGDVLFLQNVYYTSTQQLHIGLLSPTIDDDDNKCLVDVNSRPRLIECSYAAAKRMKLHWLFTQVTAHDTDTHMVRKHISLTVGLSFRLR